MCQQFLWIETFIWVATLAGKFLYPVAVVGKKSRADWRPEDQRAPGLYHQIWVLTHPVSEAKKPSDSRLFSQSNKSHTSAVNSLSGASRCLLTVPQEEHLSHDRGGAALSAGLPGGDWPVMLPVVFVSYCPRWSGDFGDAVTFELPMFL